MEAQFTLVVVKGAVELVRSMDPAAIHDHHDLFLRFLEGRHHLVQILAQLLGIKVRHNCIEDFGSTILDCPQDAEQHTAGDPAPGAIVEPRLAFEGFIAFDLTLTQGPREQTRALGGAPPAGAGQGKAPEDRFVFIKQNDLAPTCPVLEGRKVDRAIGEVGGGGIEATRGPIGA